MAPRIEPVMDPLQQRWRAETQAVMEAVTELFPGTALCLFLFDTDTGSPRLTCISNADRSRTLAIIKRWVAMQEGQPDA